MKTMWRRVFLVRLHIFGNITHFCGRTLKASPMIVMWHSFIVPFAYASCADGAAEAVPSVTER